MVADTARVSRADWVEDLIRERRSIRQFRDTPVVREVVADMLRAALWAPSPHNSQPWRFTALFEWEDKHRLAEDMAKQLRAELVADGLDPDVVEKHVSRSYARISRAPVVLLCSLVHEGLVRYPDARRDGLEWQMAVQSVGAVLQTLFLLASSRGLGTCWMAAPMYCPDIVRAAVGLPNSHHPQALVLMGYESTPGRVRERRPFDEVVDIR
jgi:F420 biosynthesis protein FbiB-like protein